jgi:hypothetical protein
VRNIAHRPRVIDGVGDAVLAVDAVREDVPGDQVEVDVPILRVLHDTPPERDLLVDRETPEHLDASEHRRRG